MEGNSKANKEPTANKPLLSEDFGLRRLGYLLVASLVFLTGGWSITAPIESAAIAPGLVQVKGKRQSVQHFEGGIVSAILVENGSWVEKGQILMTLNSARYRADREIILGRLHNVRALTSRLRAERARRSLINFPKELIDSAQNDDRASEAMANERSRFEARQAGLDGEMAVLKTQQRGLEAVAESKRVVAESISTELSDLAALLSAGYVDKQRLRELQRSKSRLLGEITDLEVAIDEVNLKIIQLDKTFQTAVLDELSISQEKLNDLHEEYMAAEDRIDRAEVRAPVAGSIMNLDLNTIGAVIKPGQELMAIVPAPDDLIVEVRISPMDIDRVAVGQPAEIRFAVFKDAYLISGTLEKISADRMVDEGADLPYYQGTVFIDSDDIQMLGPMELVPGMPAEVLIKTGSRTMMAYLTSPLARMFSRSLIED